ncbi:PKD domain-containing protein, partial [bacterium]|nr:PKD domain-containing protein [bacterium]
MKRSKIILGILILSTIVLVFSGCGGMGGMPTVPSTPEPSDDFILIQVVDPKSNIIFIAGEKNEDTLTILGEKNDQGEPIKITETLYISKQGDALFLEAGIDGLPTYIIDSEGNKITFENYSNSTVDIALYDSNENLIEGPITIDVNPQDLLELKQLYDSSHLKQKYMPWWGNFIDVQFDWALSAMTFAGNNIGIIFDEDGNPVDYIKPWEIEVNFYDLLTEDNFIIIYEATFLPTIVDIVDDLSDYVSSIGGIIAEANEYIDSVNSVNHPPTISSLTANPSSININETTAITCTASDEDVGDTLTYTWTKNGGTFEGSTSGSTITWKAPSTKANYTVSCEVSDGEASDSDQVIISVGEPATLLAPYVTASDGTYNNKVALSCNTVTGATHYQFYRATSSTGT